MIKEMENTEAENPLYHDTWMLLRKYRDVVWSLELSVQQVRRQLPCVIHLFDLLRQPAFTGKACGSLFLLFQCHF